MARRCKAVYSMNLLYHNRSTNARAEQELGARKVSFDELLALSDVVSVHTALTPETRGRFDKHAFDRMKSTAIFINTARGGIHNEADLTEALRNGSLWGAGLDVTNPEPMLPQNPLLEMPNVTVFPHIGSATLETRKAMTARAIRNLLAGLRGEPLPHPVNPEVYRRP
jgi:phosphoglycerate dehydrogenase-like enzyme